MNVKSLLRGKSAIFNTCGYNGALPYLVGYFQTLPVITSCQDAKEFETLLYSWTYCTQDVGWMMHHTEQTIIVGGKHAEMLEQRNKLPLLGSHISYYTHRLDEEDSPDFNVVPDFTVCLEAAPYLPYLMVYSGDGCYWKRCKFCKLAHDYPLVKYRQFEPRYVASVIQKVNGYNKVAGLSCDCHTVNWLKELESHLPHEAKYDAYCRGDQQDWGKLTKAGTLFIGTDYLSDAVLLKVDKGITASQLMDSIWEIQGHGINVETMFIIDLWTNQDEREEHYQNTMKLLNKSRKLKGKLTIVENRYLDLNKMNYVLLDGKIYKEIDQWKSVKSYTRNPS